MIKFLLLLIMLAPCSHASADSDLTDILFNRDATFGERQSVSDNLGQLGKDRPLQVSDAIAEVCYGVDLCAGLTEEANFPPYCADYYKPDELPQIGSECYPKYFRDNYSCNTEISKQSSATVYIAGKLIQDLRTLYQSYIYDYMIAALSKQYDVDFKHLAQNPEMLKEFFLKYPNSKLHIETITQETHSLAAYTLDCYSSLNTLLYKQDRSKITRYFNLFKGVINTMTLFPEFKEKVNRGVNFPAAVLKEHHKIGNIVCYDGFTSTAIHDPKTDMTDKPRNGFLSGKCTQRLYISYDERALGGKAISKGSAHNHEDEILFEPGACFRIDKVYPRTDPDLEEDSRMECEEGQHFNFEMTLVK